MPTSRSQQKRNLKSWEDCLTHIMIMYKWTIREYFLGGTLIESVETVNRLKNKYPTHSIKVMERTF